jgi:predicted DNA-binding transcriptional regulator YafY
MGRASQAESARRINLALNLLRRSVALSAAVEKLAASCSISARQAYRYLDRARRLKAPLSVASPKISFTVKLPDNVVGRVRKHASATHSTLSEVVCRALIAWLDRGRGRG